MAIIKCKMCGGELKIAEGFSVSECEFCGTKQTIPKVKDENIQNLFNRANNLRINAEFDKASEVYEKIIQSNEEEAEAYWGLILCKYGIEYVEDPITYKRIPTCHRASFDAVIADKDYKRAVKYADISQKEIYENEAKVIDEIQKGIVALARREEPYDVFICYKEKDEDGRRTQDSVIANDIYYQLTQEGFKVFYAAITLEDKLGQEYEPYIFSALNSSKVMLTLGTKPEYFNAVWVKNEWSRFLKIMKKDRSRMLIPCYKDMDAYDLPEEFAHLQAQDMSKIGFINDLVRGIKKVVIKEEEKKNNSQAVLHTAGYAANIMALLERGAMSLEDGEWEKADNFFEEVLNQDAKNGDAFLGKLLVKNKCIDLEKLKNKYIREFESAIEGKQLAACEEDKKHILEYSESYSIPGYYDKKQILDEYYEFDRSFVSFYQNRQLQKNKQLKEINDDNCFSRCRKYSIGETKLKIENFIKNLEEIFDKRIEEAKQQDEEIKERIIKEYQKFIEKTDNEVINNYNNTKEILENKYNKILLDMEKAKHIRDYVDIKKRLLEIKDYKEADELIKKCDNSIKESKKSEEVYKFIKKIKIVSIGLIAVLIVCVSISLLYKPIKYKVAFNLKEKGDYAKAYEKFKELKDYRNSREELKKLELFLCDVGTTVPFGDFDDCTEYIILAKEGNKALLISKNTLAYRKYNEEYESITWENSSIREWLNNHYYNEAFSENEKKIVLNTEIVNSNNSRHNISGGNNTTDKVFLLSVEEVEKYFNSDEERIAYDVDGHKEWWWLRTPGFSNTCKTYVYTDGSVSYNGYRQTVEHIAVRPAVWVDIELLKKSFN